MLVCTSFLRLNYAYRSSVLFEAQVLKAQLTIGREPVLWL